jgi:chromate transporter
MTSLGGPRGAPTEGLRRGALGELAFLFLRLGLTAFGGPATHIAMMEDEVVRRRRWLSSEEFLDLLGAANLIPGPSSTELALFIGFARAGFCGLVIGGVCFILPAAGMVMGLAWAYVRFGTIPQVAFILYGIKPVVIAVIAQALWGLAPKAIKKSPSLAALGVVAAMASALRVDALVVLAGAGLVSLSTRTSSKTKGSPSAVFLGGVATSGATAATPVGTLPLFLWFFKIGAVVFGGGYVLLAFLRADLVDRLHWITERQLLDAVAIGQVTPGPVFTTATFIGYVIGGSAGALAATVGIFLPGFLLVAVSRPLLNRVRRSPAVSAFLDGVNVAALALMAVVTVELGRSALVDWPTVAVAAVSATLLIRFGVNTTWLIVAGAIVGVCFHPI